MGRIPISLVLLAGLLLAASPPSGGAESAPTRTLIAGAVVWPGDGPPRRADVLVEGTSIVAVGLDLDATGATRIEATGLILTPGYVDARSALLVSGDERGAGKPSYLIADAIDTFDPDAAEVLAHGVTTVGVAPGHLATWGGRGAVVRLGPTPRILPDDPGVLATVAVTRGRNVPTGASVRGEWSAVVGMLGRAKSSLASRAAYERAAAGYRRAMVSWAGKAAEARKKKEKEPDPPKEPKRPGHDPDALSLAAVLEGKAPLRVEVHGAREIRSALRAARHAGVHLVLEGASGIREVADEIPESVPVVLAARAWGGPPEAKPDPADAVALAKAGVPFAIASFGPSGRRSRFLPELAAICVRAGLSRERALRAITADAARAVGLEDRVGRLEKGLIADIVCLDGDPLSPTSRVEWVMVDGRIAHRRTSR